MEHQLFLIHGLYNMKINELFDLKNAYDTQKANRGKHSWVSELPDGSELEIRIWRDDRFNPLQVYYTQFGRTRAMGEPKIGKTYSISDMDELNFDITGEGDAVRSGCSGIGAQWVCPPGAFI